MGEWTGYAQDEGDGAAEMLSGYLGSSVRLFRFIMDPKIRAYLHKQAQIKENIFRPVDTTFAVGYETTFTDGFPYLIINEVHLHVCITALSILAGIISESERQGT